MARLTSIMLIAKCFGQGVAGGWFHEISAYVISFPFAFGALCVVNKLLNWRTLFLPGAPHPPPGARAAASGDPGPVPGKTIAYDY